MAILRRASWLLLLILVLLPGLSACQPRETESPIETESPRETELPIETIGRGYRGKGGGLYEEQEPALITTTRATEGTKLGDWISADAQSQLQKLDYDTYFAVAVFQGLKPGSGFGVQIDRITRSEDIVTVFAQFQEPTPGMETTTEVISPYHVVQVQRVGTWDQDITFNLVVDNVVVAVASDVIP